MAANIAVKQSLPGEVSEFTEDRAGHVTEHGIPSSDRESKVLEVFPPNQIPLVQYRFLTFWLEDSAGDFRNRKDNIHTNGRCRVEHSHQLR